jgi:argininosuccinate lyase
MTMNAIEVPADTFHWLGEINKASAVMVVEQSIVPATLGATIAETIAKVIVEGNQPNAARPGDYLLLEAVLIEAGGPDVTRVHSGRSRQDIGATLGCLYLRDDLLAVLDALNTARDALLTLAEAHADAIIPAYTWGVQAQPTSFGHWLSAYAAALTRAAERFRQTYARVNRCPLGAAAFGTSSFPVNRPRLAELLGFDGVAENALDATQIAPADLRAEATQAAATSGLSVGMLLADITQQYAQTRPWLTLHPGEQTGVSSIMPQKRNPTGLVRLRLLASTVVGSATGFAFQAHNVPAGMHDYKPTGPDPILRDAAQMFFALAALLPTFQFDPERALEEVNVEYSTTTELADVLQREADVPFRAGHHFASELVTYGRAHRLRPADLPYTEARRLYADTAAHFGLPGELPLSESAFHQALSAEGMVQASQGLGGPQPAEVARMLAGQRQALAADQACTRATREDLVKAALQRDTAFAALQDGGR